MLDCRSEYSGAEILLGGTGRRPEHGSPPDSSTRISMPREASRSAIAGKRRRQRIPFWINSDSQAFYKRPNRVAFWFSITLTRPFSISALARQKLAIAVRSALITGIVGPFGGNPGDQPFAAAGDRDVRICSCIFRKMPTASRSLRRNAVGRRFQGRPDFRGEFPEHRRRRPAAGAWPSFPPLKITALPLLNTNSSRRRRFTFGATFRR